MLINKTTFKDSKQNNLFVDKIEWVDMKESPNSVGKCIINHYNSETERLN